MLETFAHLDALRAERRERRVAMATLVGTHGTTPKKEGARMWVGEGGRILGSVTIGGCVDARVVEEADAVLQDGRARLLSLPLGDEDAWEMGLTCGGTVDVLIECVELHDGDPMVAALDLARREVEGGRPVVIATPLAGKRRRLVVRTDGTSALSLGDARLDEAVRERAMEMFTDEGRSGLWAVGSGLEPTPLAHSPEPTAESRVFLELLSPPLTLVLVGATHLAMPLERLAREVGLRTVVVDPRDRFANRDRFPQARELRVGMASEIVASLPLGPRTLLVVVAHDYKIELPVLRVALRSEAAYVGVLGGRRRAAALREALASDLTPDELARLRMPAGLDIGSESVPEIALAVLAEAIAAARGRRGGPLANVTAP